MIGLKELAIFKNMFKYVYEWLSGIIWGKPGRLGKGKRG